jgi:PAS domain S-box-containing protein
VFQGLRNSLRVQLVLLIGALAMASAVGYVLLTTLLAQSQIEHNQSRLHRLLVTRMASQLTHDLADRSAELRFLAGLDRLRDPARSVRDKEALLLAKQASYPFYAWIGVADPQGRIIASTEPRLRGADVSQRCWFQGGRQGLHREDVHDAVLLGPLLPKPAADELPLRLMDIALPLQDRDGRLIGVLAAHLSLDWAYQLRRTLLEQLDDPATEMIVVNRSGEVIVGSPALPARATQLAKLVAVQQARAGQVTTGVEAWPDGRRYFTAAAPALGWAPYPGLDWTVLVRLDEARALADARRLGWTVMALGLSAACGFCWIIWWAVGRKLRPMERLSAAAERLDATGPLVTLPEIEGDGEVAVFARSMARLVNALGESRERFQHLFDHAPVAMAFIARDGVPQLLNARFTALLGYETRHLPHIEQWFEQAFPDRSAREQARRRWQEALPHIGGAPRALAPHEHTLRCQDGSERIVESTGIALSDGLLVSFHDLTERRRAEAELHLWAEAFERSEVGLVIIDASTNAIAAANPAFSEQRRYSPVELKGLPLPCLFPAHRTAELGQALQQLDTADHLVFESEHIARDGRVFPVLIDVSVIRDAQGRPTRRVAYVQDLSERERAAQEIHRLNAELEQRVVERTAELSAANRELDRFAGAVTHDLRAPLRTISGFAQILQDEFADALGSEGMGFVQRILGGTRRMSELVEGLLALSRHTSKPLERTRVNLSAIAERRLAELAAAEPARRVVVTIEPALEADCDAALAEALIINLLDNAWNYSAKTDVAQICFGRGEVDDLQGFCVRDNGAGFDMAQATRLFEPFQRLHHPSDFQGTGVGLATVRRIVDRHGGRITVQAAPGQGARFCFTLRAES